MTVLGARRAGVAAPARRARVADRARHRRRPRAARTLRALAAAAVVLALLTPAAAFAAAPRTSLSDVENEVMCLVCGTPLNVAQAPQANRERAYIRRLIARGETKQQVKRDLVAAYGPNVLALPKPSGFNLTVYLVPAAVVLAGLLCLALVVPRWRRRRVRRAGAGAAPVRADLGAADARRLDEDLARFDS